MALPWVRLDSHIGSHDKILALLSDPSPKRWQASFSYVCALGWSGDQGTDGKIPTVALAFVHGNATTARLLVKYRLWTEQAAGYEIVNFAERQELAAITAGKREVRRFAAEKANCPKCWTDKGCARV
jgi:hypothetical protein